MKPLAVIVFLSGTFAYSLQAYGQDNNHGPDHDSVMKLHEVRIGMKGYGLTVFKGTDIEPFPVEVISINHNQDKPRQSLIWIRCTDPVMQKNGPVQGMSGSPIYLWDDAESQQPGKGGRLIGAFALGYMLTKDCMVGVQPIEYMLDIATRAKPPESTPETQARHDSEMGLRTLLALRDAAALIQPNQNHLARLEAYIKLMQPTAAERTTDRNLTQRHLPTPGHLTDTATIRPMMLPMTLANPDLARLLDPLLRQGGIMAMADNRPYLSAPPPPGIDLDHLRLERGSVLAIPFVWGDLDLAAAGTVTDVLPDGTVLGFGHPMFGFGDAALPMATGYVNFIVPNYLSSFKNSGSLKITGSLVRDEAAGVAGIPGEHFIAFPAEVHVDMPGYTTNTYHYQIVHHPLFTPIISVISVIQSLDAQQKLPIDNTMHINGHVTFTGDRVLKIDNMIPRGSAMELAFELMPLFAMMMQNPYESLQIHELKLNVRIEPVLRTATLAGAWLDQSEVEPGDTIGLTVQLQPYGKPIVKKRLDFKLPEHIAEGDYEFTLTDAIGYAGRYLANHPHMFYATSIDDIFHTISELADIRRDRIYMMLQLMDMNIAIGRNELPDLPSSRRAVIAAPGTTLAMPYFQTIDRQIEMDTAIEGELMFTVSVRNNATATLKPARNNQ